MKAVTLVLTLCTALASTLAVADDDDRERDGEFYDRAKVVAARPVYREVPVTRTVRECVDRPVRRRRRGGGSYTPEIFGGLVGGVVGNQFGGGHGKTALTVAGALLGASVGHDLKRRAHRRRHWDSVAEHCYTREVVRMEEELDGYRVRYRYRGQEFVTWTDEHPGKFIRVKVGVTPKIASRDLHPVYHGPGTSCRGCEGDEYF